MPFVVPIQPVPSQIFSVQLGGQSCQISLYQQGAYIYCDLFVGTAPIAQGVMCRNNVKIVQYGYLGFIGDLAFVDTQPDSVLGPTDPVYTGLGARYMFVYYTPDDLAGAA